MEGPLSPGAANANGNGSVRSPSPTPPAIDPQLIVDYLEKVLEVNLGASPADLRAPDSLLSSPKISDTLQQCSGFAQGDNRTVVYIVKDRVEQESADDLNAPNGKTLILRAPSTTRFR